MKLYKFRSVNTNNLTALSNNQIWFSTLKSFNDPFEGAHSLNVDLPLKISSSFNPKPKESVGQEEYLKMLEDMALVEGEFSKEELFQKIAEHDLEKLIAIIQNTKIASFSLYSDKRDPIYENLMWSHYADGLRGYCLVFDYEKLLEHVCYSAGKAIRPILIKYQDTPNVINLIDFVESTSMLNVSGNDYVQQVTDTIATKSEDWGYENEVRLLALEDENFHTYLSTNLVEIVIGEKMPSNQKKFIVDIVKSNNPKIKISEATLMKDSYKIQIV